VDIAAANRARQDFDQHAVGARGWTIDCDQPKRAVGTVKHGGSGVSEVGMR
jgi:hypothetical protein